MSDPTARPAPAPVSPAAESARADTYRPLSLLALVGAGLAGVYAVGVVGGGLVAFFRGNPLLPSGSLGFFFLAIVPIGGGVLSLVALVQIQRSEGTLAGEKVARWGLLLSVLVGLSYWAYYGATYFAIRQEADKFGQEYLKELANGQVESAFRLTLQPSERPPNDAKLREQLEGRFNSAGEMGPKGQLTQFAQSDLVRMLGQGGPQTKIEPLGVSKWDYQGGYQARLLYKVTTPEATFELYLAVQGKEGKRSEGRQWFAPMGGAEIKGNYPTLTEEGIRTMRVAMQSKDQLGATWLRAVSEGNTPEAFLGTLLPERSDPVRKAALGLFLADGVGLGALPCGAPGAALTAGVLAADKDLQFDAALTAEKVEPGLKEFLAGGLVRAEDKVFWAPQDVKEEVINLVRQEFRRPGQRLADSLRPDNRVHVSRMSREGGRFVVEHDIQIRIPERRYAVEGRLVIDCDAKEAEAGTVTAWRVRSVDLVSAKSIAAQGPPGAPGMPPGGLGGMRELP